MKRLVLTHITYLRPFRIEFTGFSGILKGVGKLSKLDVGGGAVGVEDVVVGVKRDGFRVKGHGRLEVTRLARRVALPHLLQKQRLRPAALSLTINLQLRGRKTQK